MAAEASADDRGRSADSVPSDERPTRSPDLEQLVVEPVGGEVDLGCSPLEPQLEPGPLGADVGAEDLDRVARAGRDPLGPL